jgi:hypothetical protein
MNDSEQGIGEDTPTHTGGGAVRHPLAPGGATHPPPGKPSKAVALIGYLGTEDPADRYVRLYRDRTFRVWIAVGVDDIVERSSPESGPGSATGQIVIRVRGDATVERCESLPASMFGPTGAHGGSEWPRV